MAIQRDITAMDNWFAGEDKAFIDTIYQADGVTPENITSWAISFMVKKRAADLDSLAKVVKTVTDGGIAITSAASGIITITVFAADTVAINPGTYRYEIKRTNTGQETVLTYGSCVIRQSVHHAIPATFDE